MEDDAYPRRLNREELDKQNRRRTIAALIFVAGMFVGMLCQAAIHLALQ
jgi:hypothetical protein